MENSVSRPVVTTTTIGVRYGLLFGLISTIVGVTMLMMKAEQSPLRWLSLLISAGGMYLAHQDFKKQNGGFMEYSQGLGIGTVMGAVSGLLSSIVTFAYTSFVDNSFAQRVLDKARQDMDARGGMSDEQIDQALAMTAKFTTPPMLFVFGLLGAVFFSFVISLVVSAFTKNSRPEFE